MWLHKQTISRFLWRNKQKYTRPRTAWWRFMIAMRHGGQLQISKSPRYNATQWNHHNFLRHSKVDFDSRKLRCKVNCSLPSCHGGTDIDWVWFLAIFAFITGRLSRNRISNARCLVISYLAKVVLILLIQLISWNLWWIYKFFRAWEMKLFALK